MADFQDRMDASRREAATRAAGHRRPAEGAEAPPLTRLIEMDKLDPHERPRRRCNNSPVGQSGCYRSSRASGAQRGVPGSTGTSLRPAIRALRERNWIAAHIRERRYELDLTQQEVAEQGSLGGTRLVSQA